MERRVLTCEPPGPRGCPGCATARAPPHCTSAPSSTEWGRVCGCAQTRVQPRCLLYTSDAADDMQCVDLG
eukprot:1837386-Rhodomonas_salina.2